MSRKEARLLRDRALRNRAWAVFNQQLTRVRADLDARGVGARAADAVTSEARDVADTGVAMARQHKGVVAGTIGALMVWLFRDQVLHLIKEITGTSGEQDDDSQDGEPDRE
jgi:hypothetical protein